MGFFLPRIAFDSAASFCSLFIEISLPLVTDGITIRGDFTAIEVIGCCKAPLCSGEIGKFGFGSANSGRNDDVLLRSVNLSDDFLVYVLVLMS